jgi:hypothetical protein
LWKSCGQNDASTASLLLTTEALVSEIPDKEEKGHGETPPGGDDRVQTVNLLRRFETSLPLLLGWC